MSQFRGSYRNFTTAAALALLLASGSAAAAPKLTKDQKTLRAHTKALKEIGGQNIQQSTAINSLNSLIGTHEGRIAAMEQNQTAMTGQSSGLADAVQSHTNQINALQTEQDRQLAERNGVILGLIGQSVASGSIASAIRTAKDAADLARTNADNALSGRIDGLSTDISNESNSRAAAITTVTNRIAAEETARRALGDSVQPAIAAAIASESTARTNAIATAITGESNARTNAIGTAVAGEANARTNAISTLTSRIATEETVRAATITTLNTRVANEEAARAAAISSEAGARLSEDQVLHTRINGIVNPGGLVSQVQSGYQWADGQLGGRIDTEVSARASGDTQIRTDMVEDYGLPSVVTSIGTNIPNPGSTVTPTDYYCQVVNLGGGHCDGSDRSCQVSITLQKTGIGTATDVLLGQSEIRTVSAEFRYENTSFSGRAEGDLRRSVGIAVQGANVVTKNLKQGTSTSTFLLGAPAIPVVTLQGAQLSDGFIDIAGSTNSWEQARKFTIEIKDTANSAVVAQLVNGAPWKPAGTIAPTVLGCANIAVSSADEASMMRDQIVFQSPYTMLLQVRGDYRAEVQVSSTK